MRSIILSTLVAALMAGCAAIDTKDEAKPEKEYRTGSNLPQRDHGGPSSVSVINADGLQKMQMPSGVSPSGGAR